MKTKTILALLTLSVTMSAHCNTTPSEREQLAFPGAQGWGRFATGGRTGSVYHVTNLNDSGSGSLRDAVSQPNRIVVFDVSGVVRITSHIVFKNNLYVAGQTAPGEGITVYGHGVSFSGADNIIVRYMRFRMGADFRPLFLLMGTGRELLRQLGQQGYSAQEHYPHELHSRTGTHDPLCRWTDAGR